MAGKQINPKFQMGKFQTEGAFATKQNSFFSNPSNWHYGCSERVPLWMRFCHEKRFLISKGGSRGIQNLSTFFRTIQDDTITSEFPIPLTPFEYGLCAFRFTYRAKPACRQTGGTSFDGMPGVLQKDSGKAD